MADGPSARLPLARPRRAEWADALSGAISLGNLAKLVSLNQAQLFLSISRASDRSA